MKGTNNKLLAIVAILLIGICTPKDLLADIRCEFSINQSEQNHFVWKVSINDCIFFLVGSVHLGQDSFYPRPDIYLECYRASDLLVMELEDEFETIGDQLVVYAEKDKLPEENFFRHHLKDSTIHGIMQIIGEDEFKLLDNYEAWILNMVIAGRRGMLAGYDPEFGIDKYFRELAKSDNKSVIGLDSLADQFELFEFDLPFGEQVALLENTMSHIEASSRLEAPLISLYGDGDVKGFGSYFVGLYDFEDPVLKHTYERVFASRNMKWVNIFEELSLQEKHTYMVVVGAGHFFGPSNILELLRSRNYRVESL